MGDLFIIFRQTKGIIFRKGFLCKEKVEALLSEHSKMVNPTKYLAMLFLPHQ